MILTNCIRPRILGGKMDLSRDGIRAVRIDTGTVDPVVDRLYANGGGRANTLGVANMITTADNDPNPTVHGSTLEAFDYGVQLGGSVRARVTDNEVLDCVTGAINSICPASATVVRRNVVQGNDIRGALVGLRFTGPPAAPATSYVLTKNTNHLFNQGFTPKIFDNGWTETT